MAATLAAAVCTRAGSGGSGAAPSRWVLVYSGGPKRPAYSIDDLRRLISVVDSTGRSVGPLCDGVILTEYLAVSGRYYMPWTNGRPSQGSDWDQYLDSLSAPDGILTRLDSAAARAGVNPVSFTVMVPYPDSTQRAFSYQGSTWDLSVHSNRAEIVDRHIHQLAHRVKSLPLRHVSFAGFYWLNESMSVSDQNVINRIADFASPLDYRVQWIPSWGAARAAQWAFFGFDADGVWQQPNYFFHPEVAPSRLDSAFAFARTAGMGIELEFDRRMFSDARFSDRLIPYLAAFEKNDDIRNKPIAIYEGAGALIQLSRSPDSRHRALYRRLVAVLRPEVRL